MRASDAAAFTSLYERHYDDVLRYARHRADYLLHIDDWPIDVRAIELVRELCERSGATCLG